MMWLDGITDSMGMNLSKPGVIAKDRGAWGSAIHGVAKSQTWLSDSITATYPKLRHSSRAHYILRHEIFTFNHLSGTHSLSDSALFSVGSLVYPDYDL